MVPSEKSMLNVTNATRIAELERALENVVEYLKKLPIHPMHNAAINAAEHKLRPPYAGSLLETVNPVFSTQCYAPNGMLTLAALVTPHSVVIKTAKVAVPRLREAHLFRLNQKLESGVVLPALTPAGQADCPEIQALLALHGGPDPSSGAT